MVKLPRYPVGPGPSSQSFNIADRAPAIAPANRQANSVEIAGAHAKGGKPHTLIGQDMHAQDLRLDGAIEAVLETANIDAVTRVSLNEVRTRINDTDPRAVPAALYGRNLAHGLLSFVTPRLRHPDVLRAEQHGVLWECLAETLSAVPEDAMARESFVVLQQELRRLILLRQNRNSLIRG